MTISLNEGERGPANPGLAALQLSRRISDEIARVAARVSGASGPDPVEPPLARNALERPYAEVLELDTGARHEILHRA
jgi:hypothetical protein